MSLLSCSEFFKFSEKLQCASEKAESLAKPYFEKISEVAAYNGEKVLSAFIKNGVAEMHLKGTTGYGYNDAGRDKLDEVFAEAVGAESALVRHGFVNGTHALSTALFGILRPNDKLLCVTGKPYDTLSEVIFGEYGGSLKEFGVKYEQVDLLSDGTPDYDGIKNSAAGAKAVYIQRSRGYSLRPSLSVGIIGKIVEAVRSVNKKAVIMVDNCYGEFTEKTEPLSVGADLIIGSLIKNPGGGIARTGGYIAGQSGLVELCSYRLTTVGTGAEVGCSLDENRSMLLGLFLAPQTVESALKTAVFASALFEQLGFEAFPKYNEPRTDIITAPKLGGEKQLIDSMAAPEPWDMPGYDSRVIMAAGAFTMGASIELSADAPLREPFAVWLQGGLTYPTGKTGILCAAKRMEEKGFI